MDIAVRYVIVPRRHLYWVEAVDRDGSRRAIEVFRNEGAAVEPCAPCNRTRRRWSCGGMRLGHHGSMWLAILGAWSPTYRVPRPCSMRRVARYPGWLCRHLARRPELKANGAACPTPECRNHNKVQIQPDCLLVHSVFGARLPS